MDSTIKEIAHSYRLKMKDISALQLACDAHMKEYSSKSRKEKKTKDDITDAAFLDEAQWLSLFTKKKSDYKSGSARFVPALIQGHRLSGLCFVATFSPTTRTVVARKIRTFV